MLDVVEDLLEYSLDDKKDIYSKVNNFIAVLILQHLYINSYYVPSYDLQLLSCTNFLNKSTFKTLAITYSISLKKGYELTVSS